MKRKPTTKAFVKVEAAYRRQLKKCGYRSWKQANLRRENLIIRAVWEGGGIPVAERDRKELEQLQNLADLHQRYACYEELRARDKSLRQMVRQLG